MANIVRKFRNRPYVYGVPTPPNRRSSDAKPLMCRHCGAVSLTGSDTLRQSLNRQNSFCDIECANEYKTWHNKTEEYQSRAGIRQFSEVAKLAELKRRLHAGWRCCSSCGAAHCGSSPLCRECRPVIAKERARQYGRKQYGSQLVEKAKACEYCEKQFTYTIHKDRSSRRLYCSARCGKRALRQRRKHWIRSNGHCQYISLEKLMELHDGVCCQCQCHVVRYSGKYDDALASIDHIIPLSRGGSHTWDNCQLMCIRCNTIKGNNLDTIECQ